MPKVLICNPGTLGSKLARELKHQGVDVIFATSLFIPQKISCYLPESWKIKLANRIDPELDICVVQHPIPELIQLLLAKLFPSKADSLIHWRNQRFGIWIAKNHLDEVNVIWSFDTASEYIFRIAKYRGISRVLDMSIAHPAAGETILLKHVDRSPEFWNELDSPDKDVDELQSRDNELLFADIVVAASSFTAATIRQFSQTQASIKVIPYGVDLKQFQPRQVRKKTSELLIFLFVGWFSQRKGVYDLLKAWEKLDLEGKAKLLLAGGTKKDLECWNGEFPSNVECVGRVSRKRIGDLYSAADVFVFPSLFEGFGLVLLEAMASGLPIVTTTNTAGPDLIEDGIEGFICAPGDRQALVEKMRVLAENDSLRISMGKKARKKAEEYTWDAYGRKCWKICQELCSRNEQKK